MNTLNILALVAHVLIALGIIAFVLLQRGKGADAGTGFGAGASGTVFGSRGSANFLSRSTAVLATLFFASSLGLAYLNSNKQADASLFDAAVVEESAPVATGGTEESEAFDLPPVVESDDSAAAGEELPVVPE